MKLKRIKKNAIMLFAYGASFRQFKKQVRASPDDNIKRLPARKLKQIANETLEELNLVHRKMFSCLALI